MAYFNFNKVTLGGRLTADPELKTTPSGVSVVTFGLAVNRKYSKEAQNQEADFFNVTAWRNTAELVCRHFRKGSSICVCGEVRNSSWEDSQKVKHYRADILANEVYFVDSRSENSTEPMEPQDAVTPAEFIANSDDDLPF